MRYKKTIVCLLGMLIYAVSFHAASAEIPQLSLESISHEEGINSEFSVAVMLTTSASVNGFDIQVHFSDALLSFTRFDAASSVVNLWKDEPRVTSPGVIRFTGGVVGGVEGEKKPIVTLHFHAAREGVAAFSFEKSFLYLNDGNGTEIIPRMSGEAIAIKKNASRVPYEKPLPDTTSPVLNFNIVPNPLEKHSYLVAFNASDDESGIKDVFLKTRSWITWSEYMPVKNPVALPRGIWEVALRAVNNENLTVDTSAFLYGEIFKKTGALGVLILLVAGAFFLYHRKREHS